MIKKTLQSFRFAWNGLVTVWREERNFPIATVIAVIVLLLLFYFNFSFVESALCVFAIVMVLSAEILNTAVEDVCNRIEPNHDLIIGKIKDMMSGFVLVSVIGSAVVAILVMCHHFSLLV